MQEIEKHEPTLASLVGTQGSVNSDHWEEKRTTDYRPDGTVRRTTESRTQTRIYDRP